MVAVLLAPTNSFAADDYEAVKAETLRAAGITPPATATAPAWWPWKTTDPAQPPALKPYQLPTLADDGLDYHAAPAPLMPAPSIDADAVFNRVLACYPARSKFDIDVDLRAAIRSSDVLDLDTSTGLGKSYVGVVASMPLYSGKELDREKEREYNRRKDTAKAVAAFITAIAGRTMPCVNSPYIAAWKPVARFASKKALPKPANKWVIWKKSPIHKPSYSAKKRRLWKTVSCSQACVTPPMPKSSGLGSPTSPPCRRTIREALPHCQTLIRQPTLGAES